MKILEPIKINITAVKSHYGADISINSIKSDLELEGAVVRGYTDGSSIVMEISGDIDLDQIEMVFIDSGISDIDAFIIDEVNYDADEFDEEDELLDENDEFIPEYDEVDECGEMDECGDYIPEYDEVDECDDVFESKNVRFSKSLIESVKNECKVKKSRKMVNLAEALGHTSKTNEKSLTLDEVIDSMIGVGLNESIAEKAIAKAKQARLNSLKEFEDKLGQKRCFRILESLRAESPFMYPDVKINGVRIAEYSINQLKGLQEKLNVQISELERKISLNEGDTAMLEKELNSKKTLQTMLEDELTYRLAFEHNVNEDEEKKNSELDSLSDSPKAEDNEETPEEEEVNPDKDEETEVSNIVITLANKEAAESLKSDLVAAGVPEDVIVIEAIETEDDEEESDEDVVEDTEDKEDEEVAEEKTEESASVSGSKLNEDEEAEAEETEESEDEEAEDAEESEEETEETEDEAVKLILKDTDYVESLVNVLEDTWGLDREEFEEMIGGEIVAETEDEDEDEDESEDSETSADDEEFDPDEIFKDL